MRIHENNTRLYLLFHPQKTSTMQARAVDDETVSYLDKEVEDGNDDRTYQAVECVEKI